MIDSKDVIRAHFGEVAARYTASAIHAQGEDLKWLIEAAQLQGTEKVLDLGTGAGHAAFAFAPYVKSVEGLDITPAMLEQAEMNAEQRKLNNVRFSLGDAERIPREDATYDIVVSRWCAHHYLNIRQAVAEIARVLKPNGVFFLIDSYVPSAARADTFINTLEILRDTGHVRNYSISEWLTMLETVNLHGEVLHEWLLRLDGDNWVERIKTPAVYVTAIQALLQEADHDLKTALNITSETDEFGWGFDLPSVFIKATRL